MCFTIVYGKRLYVKHYATNLDKWIIRGFFVGAVATLVGFLVVMLIISWW